jgi:tetratricopeptide (TPR) repeat protein
MSNACCRAFADSHWVLAVALIQQKRILYRDALGGSGHKYTSAIKRYLADEMREKRGVEMTQGKEPALLDALAAAYAQSNRFTEACEHVTKAIEILPQGKTSPQADVLRARLALFQQEKPYREAVPGAPQ